MRHKDLQEILITGKTFDPPGSPKKQPPAGGRPEKRHKYAVSPRDERTVDGITFASKREMRAFLTLQMAEKAGAIQNLRRQVRFTWDVTYSANGQEYKKTESYIADFTWVENGEAVVADVKAMTEEKYMARRKRTKKRMESMEVYLRKKRIMQALFGVCVKEL